MNYPILVILDWLYTLFYRRKCGNNCYPFYLGTESSRLLRRLYKVTGKYTSTSDRNFDEIWNVESQKPTRDEHSCVIGMALAGANINYVAAHFYIHKTIAYRINNRFVQRKLAGDRPRSCRKKLIPPEESFIQIISRRRNFLKHTCFA